MARDKYCQVSSHFNTLGCWFRVLLTKKLSPLLAKFKIPMWGPAGPPSDHSTQVWALYLNLKGNFTYAQTNCATPISNAKKKKGMPSLRSGINYKYDTWYLSSVIPPLSEKRGDNDMNWGVIIELWPCHFNPSLFVMRYWKDALFYSPSFFIHYSILTPPSLF